MAHTIDVLGIAGSLREGSHNRGLLRAAAELLPEGMELEIYSLRGIPFYDADLEASGMPEPVHRFKERVAAADALLIATPEYSYSIPAVLKNALDWASRPPHNVLTEKPIALMGASVGPYGTVRAQLHLRQIFTYSGSLPLAKPDVYVVRAEERFDSEGNLTDEETRQRVGMLLQALGGWVQRLGPRR